MEHSSKDEYIGQIALLNASLVKLGDREQMWSNFNFFWVLYIKVVLVGGLSKHKSNHQRVKLLIEKNLKSI